ncbi:glucokinase [Hansschlegelia sp. KR7-227]|uniref:glucokinase n=1 Tax=Hansschlegelia sp. KR7-227 TaxID=3400914 RepID=UPI003C030299
MTLIVGDIGGTNSRFGLVDGASPRPRGVGAQPNARHESFDDALAAYLAGAPERPKRAAFAVAGPIDGRTARLTNRAGWAIDADALARRFGFDAVTLMNDFAAQAAALPHLGPDEVAAIGDVGPSGDANKAAVGPGTGLGVAALLRVDGQWLPLATEGGHVELAATDAIEWEAFAALRRTLGRVSAEDVLAGPGLARLHGALALARGEAEDSAEPAELTARASEGDARARATITLFLTMLARFAGDVALNYGANGGVYLCGGVAPKLLPFVDAPAFRAAFEAKRPHEERMRKIATLVVTAAEAGLIGCAAAVAG